MSALDSRPARKVAAVDWQPLHTQAFFQVVCLRSVASVATMHRSAWRPTGNHQRLRGKSPLCDHVPSSSDVEMCCGSGLWLAGHTKQVELDDHLSRIMPADMTKYFYCNSGSEAVDNAVKIARAVTGRQNIIAFDVSMAVWDGNRRDVFQDWMAPCAWSFQMAAAVMKHKSPR